MNGPRGTLAMLLVAYVPLVFGSLWLRDRIAHALDVRAELRARAELGRYLHRRRAAEARALDRLNGLAP